MLENVQSAPTRALLKQWANPVKIAPDETILTMKNEIFLNQVQNGSKKQAVIDAVNNLFGQSNSNVVIRLPQASDAQIKPSTPVVAQKPVPIVKPAEPIIQPEEVQEAQEIIQEETQKNETVKKIESSMHSDNVNMVMDLFDGKVIE